MRHLAIFLSVLLGVLTQVAHAQDAGCGPLPASLTTAMRLPHIGAGRLDILAIGSGSVLGPNGQEQGSLAAIFADRLRARLPDRLITLRVIGRRGETAEEMLGTLRMVMAQRMTKLVLWQTGTVEAIRKLPAPAFQATLGEGLRVIAEAQGDAILIDPQYSRRLVERVDVRPYRTALQEAAHAAGAAFFHRWGAMRAWSESGGLDLDRVNRRDRPMAMARLHACLGTALADQVVGAIAAR